MHEPQKVSLATVHLHKFARFSFAQWHFPAKLDEGFAREGFSLYALYEDVPLDRYGLTKNCLT